MPSTRTLFLLSLVVLMGCAAEKAAEKPAAVNPPAIKNFALTPGDEVPPCPAGAPGSQGTANVALSPDESSLTATVNYSGLSGPATAAHIHAGKAGVAGPVVLPFGGDLSSPINKTFTAATTSPPRTLRPTSRASSRASRAVVRTSMSTPRRASRARSADRSRSRPSTRSLTRATRGFAAPGAQAGGVWVSAPWRARPVPLAPGSPCGAAPSLPWRPPTMAALLRSSPPSPVIDE